MHRNLKLYDGAEREIYLGTDEGLYLVYVLCTKRLVLTKVATFKERVFPMAKIETVMVNTEGVGH